MFDSFAAYYDSNQLTSLRVTSSISIILPCYGSFSKHWLWCSCGCSSSCEHVLTQDLSQKGCLASKKCTVVSWSCTHPTPPSCRKRMKQVKCSNSWMDVVEKNIPGEAQCPKIFFHTLVDSGHTHLWPYNSSNVSGAQTLNQIVHADPHVRPPAFEALAATLREVQDLQKSNNIYSWKKSSSCKISHNIQL